MSSREDLGKALLECLREAASLLEHARRAAIKQQNALVENDAEAIVLTTRAQEEVLRRINEADQRAAAVASKLMEDAELDPETANSKSIAMAAGHPYSNLIIREMDNISELAGQVQRENQITSHLLHNGLDIIACCLRALATEPGPVAYGRNANMSEGQSFVLSLDRKA